MRQPSIKQFKLTNDDEVICEVLEWDTEENSAMIVRACLRIIQGVDVDKGMRFFAFRPWMGFAEDPETLHTLNSSHIIGETNPSDQLLKHYSNTISKLLKASKLLKHDFNIDEMNDMDEDEIEDYIQYQLSKVDEEEDGDDPDSNVISFKPKSDTRH